MSDIASVASGAVAAYQRALGTVSNNIANASTPGYARQVSTLEANPIAKMGNLFMGTGVNVTAISRAYDSFVEANYRNSNSDLLSQEPMVNYTNRIVDVMGSDSMGLSSAMDQFFNAARMLSTDPASTALRGSFMADAKSVSSRFGEISGQLDLVQNGTTQAVTSYVDQISTITSALAAATRSAPRALGTNTASLTPGLRCTCAITSAASANCGKARGDTNEVASTLRRPASIKASITATLSATLICSFSA